MVQMPDGVEAQLKTRCFQIHEYRNVFSAETFEEIQIIQVKFYSSFLSVRKLRTVTHHSEPFPPSIFQRNHWSRHEIKPFKQNNIANNWSQTTPRQLIGSINKIHMGINHLSAAVSQVGSLNGKTHQPKS